MTRDSGGTDVGGSFATKGCAEKLSQCLTLDVNDVGTGKMYRRHWLL